MGQIERLMVRVCSFLILVVVNIKIMWKLKSQVCIQSVSQSKFIVPCQMHVW